MSEVLYWRLHTLSKMLESSDIIDGTVHRDAYPAILDAMEFVAEAKRRADKPTPHDPIVKATLAEAMQDALITGEGWARVSFESPVTVLHDEVLEVDLKAGTARAVPAEPALTGTMAFDGVSRVVAGTDAGVNVPRTVASIPDADLLRRVVRHVVRSMRRQEFAWAKVSEAFGLGSTFSMQLCRRFDLDPDTGAAIEAEPTRSQKLAAAGFVARDKRLACDECGGMFTAQMLPIHKCPAQEEAPPCGQICNGVPCPTPRRGNERLCPDCNPRSRARAVRGQP